MTDTVAVRQDVGDWDLRGMDCQTALIGPVTESIVDADRMVRLEFQNGVPNFMLYRTAYAGDALYRRRVLDWMIAFALVVAEDTMRQAEGRDELALVAAHDVLSILERGKAVLPHTIIADRLGFHRETYLRLRNRLYLRMDGSLREYWMRLNLHYPRVLRYNRTLS